MKECVLCGTEMDTLIFYEQIGMVCTHECVHRHLTNRKEKLQRENGLLRKKINELKTIISKHESMEKID